MNFLKKHWEKFLLALALLALIVAGAMLMSRIDALQQNVNASPLGSKKPKDKLPPVDEVPYTNAMVQLEKPLLWGPFDHDPFIRPVDVEPEIIDLPPEPRYTNDVTLIGARFVPFKLLFKSYSSDEENKTGRDFQINFQYRSHTFFVSGTNSPIADLEVDTGYRTIKFERKHVVVQDPTLNAPVQQDISELTIQHPGDEPIKLVYGKTAHEKEPVAKIQCTPEFDPPRQYEVRRGQRFECEGHAYIVVDITPKQVVIKDAKTDEQRTLDVAVPAPSQPLP